MNEIDGMACATPGCDNRGKPGLNLVGYGSFATKSGRRRRYRCTICRRTLSTNTGTAYRGLRCTRREFDHVASLRVEGVSISSTARVTGHSRNTIARWLERASTAAKHFNDRMLRDFDLIELQADELCTFIGKKSQTCWLFATLEVSSRLWAGSLLGRRSDRNAWAIISDVIRRGRVVGAPLIATDGFESYVGAIRSLFGSACVYGHVLKTRRNNRVVRVERRVKIGTATRLRAALWESEDSETLNTSFVERLNLTIRQGSAYLRRRSPCHARCEAPLRGHVELVRCHYNFVRPHRALKFGRETRTPAMQAGLVSTRLTWSHIFTASGLSRRLLVAVVRIPVIGQRREPGTTERRCCMNTLWGWGRASWAGCGPDVRRGGQTLIMGYSADKSPLIGHLAGPLRRLEPLGAQRQEKCGPNRPTPTGYSCNNAPRMAGGRRRLPWSDGSRLTSVNSSMSGRHWSAPRRGTRP